MRKNWVTVAKLAPLSSAGHSPPPVPQAVYTWVRSRKQKAGPLFKPPPKGDFCSSWMSCAWVPLRTQSSVGSVTHVGEKAWSYLCHSQLSSGFITRSQLRKRYVQCLELDWVGYKQGAHLLLRNSCLQGRKQGWGAQKEADVATQTSLCASYEVEFQGWHFLAGVTYTAGIKCQVPCMSH